MLGKEKHHWKVDPSFIAHPICQSPRPCFGLWLPIVETEWLNVVPFGLWMSMVAFEKLKLQRKKNACQNTLHSRWQQHSEQKFSTISCLHKILESTGIRPRSLEATLPLGMYGYTSNRSVGVIQNPRSRNKFRCTAILIISTWHTMKLWCKYQAKN